MNGEEVIYERSHDEWKREAYNLVIVTWPWPDLTAPELL